MNADELFESDLELDANHLALREIGPWLRTLLADGQRSDSPQVGVIELAIHELATNSVDHAASVDGRLTLSASIVGEQLHIRLLDKGKPFQPEAVEKPSEPQVRGYGMMIIEQVCESLSCERVDDANVWRAQFVL